MKWLIGIAILIAITFIFKLGLLVYAAYALFGILLVSNWITKSWATSLHAVRTCDHKTVEIGEKVHAKLRLQNRGRLPIGWFLVEDLLPARALIFKPPNLDVEGERLQILSLMPSQTKLLEYEMQCNRRGYYQIGPTIMETGDYFGLQRRFRVVAQPTYLLVLPKVIPLEGYEISSKRPIGEIRMTFRLFEDPTRISGVRLYEKGDSLNRIHWRATAKTGELHSKVYEPSTIAGATILLEFHKNSHPKKHEPLRSDLAITMSASLANAIYEMSQPFGLVSNGRDAVDRIRTEGWQGDARTRDEAKTSAAMLEQSDRLRPVVVNNDRGAEQLMQIRETLARLELTSGLRFSQLVAESAERLSRDSSIIAILPSVSHDDAVALGILKRNGFSVTAIINVFEYEEFINSSGLLLAEGIPALQLRDENSISAICRDRVMLNNV